MNNLLNDKVLELTIINKDWIPESMKYSVLVFVSDMKIVDLEEDVTKKGISYNFSYNSNDRHESYLKDNLHKLQIDVEKALIKMFNSAVKENINE